MTTPHGEHAHFWHDPHLNGLELLTACFHEHSFAPHAHESFVVAIIVEGAEQYRYRGGQRVAASGMIAQINPEEIHTGCSAVDIEIGWSYRVFYPMPAMMQQIASDMAGRPMAVPYFPDEPIVNLQTAQMLIHAHCVLEVSADRLEKESILQQAMAQFIARHAVARPNLAVLGKEQRAVRQVLDYLADHYADNIALESLSTLTGLSPFYLNRVFKRDVGVPPHAYLTQLRVQRARQLLKAGVSLVDAATYTGFADQSHMTRHFKRIVGVPPGHYARNLVVGAA